MSERQPVVIPADFETTRQPVVLADGTEPLTLSPVETVLRLVSFGEVGPQGVPGTSFQTVAGANLSGHRVVRPQLDGTVVYASNADLADAGRPLWLTLGAALAGDAVQVQGFGLIVEPSWSWADGPIYLGVDGLLTQTPPVAPAGFLLQLAASDSPTSLFYDPRIPIAVE